MDWISVSRYTRYKICLMNDPIFRLYEGLFRNEVEGCKYIR